MHNISGRRTHSDHLKLGSQVLVPRWWRRLGEVFSPEADGRLACAMMSWRPRAAAASCGLVLVKALP